MARYIRSRVELFVVSAVFGAAATTAIFEARTLEPLWMASHYRSAASYYAVLASVSILPSIICYIVACWINRIFIRLFGGAELADLERQILRGLIRAGSTGEGITRAPANLLEEEAWTRLRRYWKRK